MAKFEKIRTDAIIEKNKTVLKAYELKDAGECLKEKADKTKEGISRIPNDLPDEMKQQIDAICQNALADLKAESNRLASEAQEARAYADESREKMILEASKLKKQGDQVSRLRKVPLIGKFAEVKGDELKDHGEQMFDLAKETLEYSDELADIEISIRGI